LVSHTTQSTGILLTTKQSFCTSQIRTL